jgi:hypothetical protein
MTTREARMREMSPEEAQVFIRRVMGPPRRVLEDEERDHVWLILNMTEPTSTSNNQHSWCEEYYVGGKYYDVHYFPNEEPIIEEILRDETNT